MQGTNIACKRIRTTEFPMNTMTKHPHYPLLVALAGAAAGYLVVHPVVMVINNVFHVHQGMSLHMKNGVFDIFFSSYSLMHWPHIVSYLLLSGAVGYLFGKKINAYKMLNMQMERFSRIGRNAACIIHDLNNHLNVIGGSAELLKTNTRHLEDEKYCDMVKEGVRRISKMILDIKITLKESDGFILIPKPTDFRLLVEELLSRMKLSANLEVSIALETQLMIDHEYFERVLWNLIKNADEACGSMPEASIKIGAWDIGGSVLICISDNGPGIPKKLLAHLFEMGSPSGKRGGSGIGLYNCREIVKAHKGRIWLDSTPGTGTQAYISLPKAAVGSLKKATR